MAGIASVTVIGNLGADPEIRYTPAGAMLCSFSLAATRKWNDQNGKPQEKTNWFRCTAWGRLAETMEKLVSMRAMVKGKQVYVSGDFDLRDFVGRDGATRTSADVKVVDFQLLGNRSDSEPQQASNRQQQSGIEDFHYDPADAGAVSNPLKAHDPTEIVKPPVRVIEIPF